jgi:hypothetical protein
VLIMSEAAIQEMRQSKKLLPMSSRSFATMPRPLGLFITGK